MEIKRASPLDISALLAMLAEMHENTEMNVSPINSEKLISKVNELIHKGIIFIAIDEKNNLAGSIGGCIARDWWSDEPYLSDCWFYVSPKYRGSSASMKLAKRFVKAGKENKLSVRLGHIFSGKIEKKDKFFERLGMKKAGSVFVEV